MSTLKELRLGNAPNIQFMGELQNDLIPEIINCADVLALTSFFEGSPTVIKEALACGIPIVSTDVGDVKYILNKDSLIGKIVPKNDESSFAQAIIEVLNNKDHKIKKRCREISKQFDSEIVALRMVEICEQMLQR